VILAATTAMHAVGFDVVLIAESRGHDAQNHASSPKRRNARHMRSGVAHPTLSGGWITDQDCQAASVENEDVHAV